MLRSSLSRILPWDGPRLLVTAPDRWAGPSRLRPLHALASRGFETTAKSSRGNILDRRDIEKAPSVPTPSIGGPHPANPAKSGVRIPSVRSRDCPDCAGSPAGSVKLVTD